MKRLVAHIKETNALYAAWKRYVKRWNLHDYRYSTAEVMNFHTCFKAGWKAAIAHRGGRSHEAQIQAAV